jgi:hypothetical protein
MKSPLLPAILAVCGSTEIVAQRGEYPTRAETERRVVEFVSGSDATLADGDSLARLAMGYLPQGVSELSVRVQLREPRASGGHTVISGRYYFSGIEEIESDIRFVFAGDALIALDRPQFSRAALLVAPGTPQVSKDQASEIAHRFTDVRFPGTDCAVAVGDLYFRRETSRTAYSVTVTRNWGDPEIDRIPEPPLGLTTHFDVDAVTGEIFDIGRFSLNDTVSGVCSGESLALEGSPVRHAQGPNNLRELRPLRDLPLVLSHPELPFPRRVVTGVDGAFSFDVPGQGEWRLTSDFASDEFVLEYTRNAHEVGVDITGQGAQSVAAMFSHDRDDEIVRESMAGTVYTWELLNTLRRWGEEVRIRNGIIWPSTGTLTFGIPGNRRIRVIRAEARPGIRPFGGVYFDSTLDPTIALSEANDLYHCWGAASVIAHEWGHSLLLSYTGQYTLQPPPRGHSLIFHEALGDVMAWLYQEHVDLGGEPQGIIGLGQQRGHEDSDFRRDIRAGRTCDAEPDPRSPCLPRGGLGLYPVVEGVHESSLPISGFFYDLGELMKARYGSRSGHERIGDLVVRYLAFHAGGMVPNFEYERLFVLLLINDDEVFGGDNNPFNAGPDWDLIRQAALGRNLWLIPFLRGDSDADGSLSISDAVFVLNYLFLGRGEPNCHDAADADDSGDLNITDAVRLLGFLFLGGGPLPPPTSCDVADLASRLDPTPLDQLTCKFAGEQCRN